MGRVESGTARDSAGRCGLYPWNTTDKVNGELCKWDGSYGDVEIWMKSISEPTLSGVGRCMKMGDLLASISSRDHLGAVQFYGLY